MDTCISSTDFKELANDKSQEWINREEKNIQDEMATQVESENIEQKESTLSSEPLDTSISSTDSPDLKELVNDKSQERINPEEKNILYEATTQVKSENIEQKEATLSSEPLGTSISSTDSPDLKELVNDKSRERINPEEKNILYEAATQVESENIEMKEATLSLVGTLTKEAVDKHNEINKESYRYEVDSSTDDSSSTFSLDSKSDCSDSFLHKMQMNVNTSLSNKVTNLKTKGELDLEELPLIQDLEISLKESELEKVGLIHAVVNTLVIVRALKNLQPLDIDSILFLTSQKPLGRIFDVFGPILEPYYIVRFNSPEHVIDVGVTVESEVFYAPQKEDITTYVFVEELKKQKGSDASWKDNNEPPEEFMDYSDDEQEKVAKQKRKAKNRLKPFDGEPQSNKRDQPSSTLSKDMRQSHQSTFAPAVLKNTYRSMRPNVSQSNTSNRISLAAVMSSDYRPNPSRSQNSFQGPPIYAQNRNPFGVHQSYRPQLQCAPAPPPRHFTPDRPTEAPFRPPLPFVSQPQQNLGPGLQTYSYHPPQSPFQPHQPTISQPVRSPPMHLQQQGTHSNPVVFQQSHVFGQMTPLGPMSPVQKQHPHHFGPVTSPPPPFTPIPTSPASPNFSYFSHNFASSPSPPASGHLLTNSPWFQGQSACRPPHRFITPMSPLSIQIPNNMNTPPPTIPVSSYNAVSPINPFQNGRPPFIFPPHVHPF